MILAAPIAAKKRGGHGKGHGDSRLEVSVFLTDHRRLITEYYRVQPSGLPPGLARRHGDLPPGLEKQLRRNGRLPPGLEKKLVPFPVEIERRLPPVVAGAQRGMIGGRAVIYDPRKSMILDVFVAF